MGRGVVLVPCEGVRIDSPNRRGYLRETEVTRERGLGEAIPIRPQRRPTDRPYYDVIPVPVLPPPYCLGVSPGLRYRWKTYTRPIEG